MFQTLREVSAVLGLKRMTFTPSSLWFQHYSQPLMSRTRHRDLSVSYSIKLQTRWACTQSKCIYVWSCTLRFLVLFMSNKTWGVLDWLAWLNKTRDYTTPDRHRQLVMFSETESVISMYIKTVIISGSGGLSFNNPSVILKITLYFFDCV